MKVATLTKLMSRSRKWCLCCCLVLLNMALTTTTNIGWGEGTNYSKFTEEMCESRCRWLLLLPRQWRRRQQRQLFVACHNNKCSVFRCINGLSPALLSYFCNAYFYIYLCKFHCNI